MERTDETLHPGHRSLRLKDFDYRSPGLLLPDDLYIRKEMRPFANRRPWRSVESAWANCPRVLAPDSRAVLARDIARVCGHAQSFARDLAVEHWWTTSRHAWAPARAADTPRLDWGNCEVVQGSRHAKSACRVALGWRGVATQLFWARAARREGTRTRSQIHRGKLFEVVFRQRKSEVQGL